MKAAIYARQSIEKADSVSIDAQIERCRAVCTANGWEAEIYSDAGFSGKNIARPAFERLLDGVQKETIRAIVSYKLDRVSRSITDFANLLQLFDRHGVQYVSATEQFDTSTPMGRAMIYIVMVFAQLERETITQRVSDNYRFRAAKGLYMGGNAPLGYASRQILLEGRHASVLEPEPAAAELVRQIYRSYLGGANTHRLARKLNAGGAVTSQGHLFSAAACSRILKNIAYCANTPELYAYLADQGCTVYNGLDAFDGKHGMCCFFKNRDKNKPTSPSERLVVVGRHEPLIRAEEWIAVQRMLARNGAGPAGGTGPAGGAPRRSSRSWLAGLTKCAECGCSFGLKYTQKSGRVYAYYYCRGKSNHGEGSCSNRLWIPSRELESRMEALLRGHAEQVLKGGVRKEPQEPSEDEVLIRLRQELVACGLQIKAMMENLGKGGAVVDRYVSDYITGLDSRRAGLQRQIESVETQACRSGAHIPGTPVPDEGYLKEVSRRVLDIFSGRDIEEQAQMARLFIHRVSIAKNGDVTVQWAL